ncbi:MAG: alpha/beta hydrolase [Candidatus Omnitrophota bacterium]|nr:MAG: alpha/beta hydrolase [Candidatus Omnitrophota bacterium]
MLLRKLSLPILCLIFLTGCSSIPFQRQESLYTGLYKRIPYKVEGTYRVLDVFYATSRKIDNNTRFPKSFRPELGEKMAYGIVNVKIDPALRIGKMLPNWYKKRNLLGVQEAGFLQEDIFMKELSNTINTSPHKSLLIVVFGYKDNFEYIAIETAYFAYLLDVNTPVLLFDWPGDQPVTPWGYLKAQSLAKDSGKYLGNLLTKIIREVKPEKLWIKGSSLGSQVICNAFEEMYKHEDLRDADLEIDHVIFAAPDVGEKEFDENFKNEITAFSKRLTTYVSSNDEALLMSGFINGEKKLGRQKIRVKKQDQLNEAKDILYLKSLLSDKIALVDVTPINEASYKHGYYFEAPEFFDDLYLRILDEQPHTNRHLYLLKTKDDIDYWVLRSDG